MFGGLRFGNLGFIIVVAYTRVRIGNSAIV